MKTRFGRALLGFFCTVLVCGLCGCGDKPKAKDAEPKKDAAKKDDCDGCPVAAAALKAKVDTLAKESKVVTVTGPVGACCEVSLTIAAIDEVKKPAN